jgi:hypothetical protein
MTFEQARPVLQPALDLAGGTHTLDDVESMVTDGRLQFWPGPSSAIITEIIEYPRQRTLHYFLAGGDIAEIEAMLPNIEAWGRSHGCTSASLTGRHGWSRSFLTKKDGWTPRAVVLTKDLSHEGR